MLLCHSYRELPFRETSQHREEIMVAVSSVMTKTVTPSKTRSSGMESPVRKGRLMMGSPLANKSQSFACLHSVSPSQITAKKVIRKYNTSSRMFGGQKKELTSLRQSLPHMKTASDLDLVLEAISYIQQLQQKLVTMSGNKNDITDILENNKLDERLV